MPKIEIYSADYCPYCTRAKDLFKRKGVAFTEIRVDLDDKARQAMEERTKRRTIPQIFINGQHIGGCDDLYALDAKNQLDPLLFTTP